MGFYYGGAIQPEIAKITARRDNIVFEEKVAKALGESKDLVDQTIGCLISTMLRAGDRVDGEPYQVFLLTPPDDPETLQLLHPIRNTKTDRNGRPWAWTMSQAYTNTEALRAGPETTTELDELGH